MLLFHAFVPTSYPQVNYFLQLYPICGYKWIDRKVPRCAKTDTLKLRLSAEEKEAFQDAAKLSGIALSAWMRERLRRAATRELEDAGREIAFLRTRDMSREYISI